MSNERSQYSAGGPVQRAITPGGHPLDTSQTGFPANYHRNFANPAPLGLFAFATTTFVLSMYNVGVRSITEPNAVVGLALFYGGLGQLLAGMWEFAAGNTFGATAFSSYGGFWLSFGTLLVPDSGVTAAYTPAGMTAPGPMFDQALGLYLVGWFLVTFILFLGAFRSSIGLLGVFFFLWITFVLLFAFYMTGVKHLQLAGGIFGIITAFNAWYVGIAGLLTPETSYVLLPLGPLQVKD